MLPLPLPRETFAYLGVMCACTFTLSLGSLLGGHSLIVKTCWSINNIPVHITMMMCLKVKCCSIVCILFHGWLEWLVG